MPICRSNLLQLRPASSSFSGISFSRFRSCGGQQMDKTSRIRELNDKFRATLLGGRVLLSAGVAALDNAGKAAVLEKVRTFSGFNHDNDPHHEHDFACVDYDGEHYFAKIDYYTPDLTAGSEDPSDPTQTTRVLTIMKAD